MGTYGYIRVSSTDQCEDRQRIALDAVQVPAEHIYGWVWEYGVEDVYNFEQDYIVSYNADYTSVSGK